MKIRAAEKVRENNPDAGFTLLEIMMALLIISIGIVAVVSLSRTNLKGLSRADEQIESSMRAQAKMREVLSLPSFKTKVWSVTDDAGYTYDVSVEETMKERTDSLSVIMNEITVTTSWMRGENKKRIILKTAKLSSKAES